MKVKQFTCNPIMENTYVVYDETCDAAIIDCGCLFQKEKDAVLTFFRDNNLHLKYLLNTHLHFDHSFGNHWATDTFGVMPKANANDEFLIGQMQEQVHYFGMPYEVESQPLGSYLSEGEVFVIGNFSLKVIETPGHTPGGVCFYNEDEHVLFSGDTLFEGGIGRTDLQGGDYGTIIKSLKKLMLLPENTVVYCGHGSSTTIGSEKRSNPYL